MEVPETADARTLAAWDALADRVAATLRRAGLPVTGPTTDVTNGRTGRKYGAFVEVDPIADSAGGVFVFWQVPDELARPSREALLAGRLNDPAIQRYGHVVAIMIDAIKRLLAESKFAVEDAATVNDLRPLEIHVRSAGREPPPASLSAKATRFRPAGTGCLNGFCRRAMSVTVRCRLALSSVGQSASDRGPGHLGDTPDVGQVPGGAATGRLLLLLSPLLIVSAGLDDS